MSNIAYAQIYPESAFEKWVEELSPLLFGMKSMPLVEKIKQL